MKCLTEKNELAMFLHLSDSVSYSNGAHMLTVTKRFCKQANMDCVNLPLILEFLF